MLRLAFVLFLALPAAPAHAAPAAPSPIPLWNEPPPMQRTTVLEHNMPSAWEDEEEALCEEDEESQRRAPGDGCGSPHPIALPLPPMLVSILVHASPGTGRLHSASGGYPARHYDSQAPPRPYF